MRCLAFVVYLTCCSLIGGMWAAESAASPWAKLDIAYRQGEVQLRWAVTAWPEALMGFAVERRRDDGSFQRLNKETIRPELTITNARLQMASSTVKRIAEGRLQEVPFQLVTGEFRAQKDLAAYCESMWNDLDLALVHGLAYVDWEPPYGKVSVYRVAPLFSPESTVTWPNSPEVTVHAAVTYATLPMDKVVAERLSDGKVKLSWQAQAADCTEISGFTVYRNTSHRPVEEAGETVPLTAGEAVDGMLRFSFVNPQVFPNEFVKYAVRPLSTRENVDYDLSRRVMLPRPLPQVPQPTLDSIVLTPDRGKVTWTCKILADLVDEVRVLRRDTASNQEHIVAETKPLIQSAWDSKPPAPGTRVQYRLGVNLADRGWLWTDWSEEYIWPGTAPTPSAAPQVQPALIADRPGITVTWEKVAGADGYLVEVAEPGQPWSEIYRGPETTCQHAVGNLSEESLLLVRLSCAGAAAAPGAPSPVTRYLCVGQGVMPPLVLSATPTPERMLFLTWRFPERSDLKGFRLYNGQQRVLDEIKLGPMTREYYLSEVQPGVPMKFKVVTVGLDGRELSASDEVSVVVEGGAPAASLPAPPAPDIDLATAKVETQIRYTSEQRKEVEVEYEYVVSKTGEKIFHGRKTAYWSPGKPNSILNYYLGEMDGVQRWFKQDGALLAVQLYKDGKSLDLDEYRKAVGTVTLTPEETQALKP